MVGVRLIKYLIYRALNTIIDFFYTTYLTGNHLLLSTRLSSKEDGNSFGISLMKIGNKTAPPGSMKMASEGMLLKISNN